MILTIKDSVDLFATWDRLLRRRYQSHMSVTLPVLVRLAVSEITRDEAQKMLPAEQRKKGGNHERDRGENDQ